METQNLLAWSHSSNTVSQRDRKREWKKERERERERERDRQTDRQTNIGFVASIPNYHQGYFKVQKIIQLTRYLNFRKNAKMRRNKKRFKKS